MIRSRALRLSLVLFSLFTLLSVPVSAQNAGDTAIASEQVWIRSGPSTADPILAELLTGDEVTLHGESSNGFVSVYWTDYIGWVYADYLVFPGETVAQPSNPTEPQPAAETPVAPVVEVTPAPEPEVVAPTTGGSITWPVAGGEWKILQGYNGSSHQNNSDLWQYRDSLDLVRADGTTAGQTAYSPVTGTVRWLDPSTGGISIDMGNGYAVAMFHLTIDGSISAGDTISQGQPVGFISDVGGAGYASTPHLHIAVWATSDGGNWSRTSVPFEGSLAISGYNLPNNGSGFQHTGIVFTP